MAKKHWREIITSDYLGGFDLDDGKGGFIEIDATIARATPTDVRDSEGRSTTELILRFKDKNIKPMILNVTNAKTIEKLAGSPYYEQWAGLTIRIGTERVKAFGAWHDALRVRPYPPKKQAPSVNCVECGKPITPFEGAPVDVIIAKSTEELGQPTCVPCWKAKKEAANADNQD